jgi:transcriptional regulator with XRE-family HTH domain
VRISAEQESWGARFTRSVAAEIKRQRKAKTPSWSALKLSEECARLGLDLPRSTLADLENGRRSHLGVAELLVIARALDIAPALLLFPVGHAKEAEVLPGDVRAPFRAVQWFGGEAPYPAADDDGVVTIAEVQDSASARALTLYRRADRAFESEQSEQSRARTWDATATTVSDEQMRADYIATADMHRRRAEEFRAIRGRIRKEAEAEGILPPAGAMSLREPGDALIV